MGPMIIALIAGGFYVTSVVVAGTVGAVRGAWKSGTEAHRKALESISQAQERTEKSQGC